MENPSTAQPASAPPPVRPAPAPDPAPDPVPAPSAAPAARNSTTRNSTAGPTPAGDGAPTPAATPAPARDTARPPAETVERREGPYGEVVLRRRGPHYEIVANGCFLMDTRDGRSERLLIDAALDALPPDRDGLRLLVGGLGVGFSLAHAAAQPRWARIDVVEREAAIVEWHRSGPLGAFSAGALDDPRVRVVQDDLVRYVRDGSEAAGRGGAYDALCLDIDNGPDWTVTDDNGSLYTPGGLIACRERLAPGGVLAVWSAQPSARFEAALRDAGFTEVRTLEIPVARGVPDVVHMGVTA